MSMTGNLRERSTMHAPRTALFCAAVLLATASGCAVVSVVSTVASVTASVASTAVDVGVGAVKVTAKVVGKGIDAITPSGPPQPPAAPNLSKPGSH